MKTRERASGRWLMRATCRRTLYRVSLSNGAVLPVFVQRIINGRSVRQNVKNSAHICKKGEHFLRNFRKGNHLRKHSQTLVYVLKVSAKPTTSREARVRLERSACPSRSSPRPLRVACPYVPLGNQRPQCRSDSISACPYSTRLLAIYARGVTRTPSVRRPRRCPPLPPPRHRRRSAAASVFEFHLHLHQYKE